MALLRKFIVPTQIPQTATLQPKKPPQRMDDPGFYSQPNIQDAIANPQPQTPEFVNAPITGNYLAANMERMRNRNARPELEPQSRVRLAQNDPNLSLSFQKYYDQMSSVEQIGQEMTAAAAARAEHKRLQEMQALMNQSPPAFNGNVSYNPGGSFGGSGTPSSYAPGVPSNPQANFRFAQQLAGQFGWNNSKELGAWYTLGMKESGWRNTAQNPTSTAYGIGQFLNSTWAGVGIGKTSDPYLQVLAMARYIRNRYGSPSAALAFHYRNNWY